jgi:hypothetical protein
MRSINRTAIVVKPAQPFLDWLQAVDPTSVDLTLEDLRRDPSVYLIREGGSDPEVRKNLAKVCGRIFEEQLDGWWRVPSSWPRRRGISEFERWFEWSSHSLVFDLCEAPIQHEAL